MQPGIFVMVAAHMMFNGVQSHTEVTGILGTTVTLKFSFSPEVKIQNNSHIVVHRNRTQSIKVAEYTEGNRAKAFEMHPEINSVFWHINSVRFYDNGIYWASQVHKDGFAQKSDRVELKIREANANGTVHPGPRNNSVTEDRRNWEPEMINTKITTVIVISTIVLAAAIIPFLIWSLYGVKEKKERQSQQSSSPIVQESPLSVSVSGELVVYSVLEFPKRASAVSNINPNDSEYANVSYTKKM